MNNLEAKGKRLKEVRKALDLTQEELASKLLGSSNKGTISSYENGRLEVAPKAKVILFTTLKVNKDWFETGEGEMFNEPDKITVPSGLYDTSKKQKDKNVVSRMALELAVKLGMIPKEDERDEALELLHALHESLKQENEDLRKKLNEK